MKNSITTDCSAVSMFVLLINKELRAGMGYVTLYNFV
jgi:hypothetical protein